MNRSQLSVAEESTGTAMNRSQLSVAEESTDTAMNRSQLSVAESTGSQLSVYRYSNE